MLSRRDLFRLGCCSAATVGLRNFSRFGWMNAMAAQAAPSTGYRALVCVFLFGGNDANNMVIPMDSTRFNAYTNLRKDLALPGSSLLPTPVGTELYGFHPKLSGLQKLFTAGNAAVVANVGTLVQPLTRADYLAHKPAPNNLFSHADQQLQWQTSVSNGVSTSGWAGRVADKIEYRNAPSTFPTIVSVSGNVIFGTGAQTSPGTVIPGAQLGLKGFDNSSASVARQLALQQLLTLPTGATLVQDASSTMSNGLTNAATLAKALNGAPALKTVFPNTSLGLQLQEVARIIQARQALQMNRQIFFCSLGGFDTHTAELNSHDALYDQVSQALSAFYQATVADLNIPQDITTFTESDFCRTFQPNTGHGTDHAWGSHHLVIGGAVNGGKIYGQFPQFVLGAADDSGSEGRWIPTISLDQYGATLASWFGVTSQQDLATVFPNLSNFKTSNLGFV